MTDEPLVDGQDEYVSNVSSYIIAAALGLPIPPEHRPTLTRSNPKRP